VLGGDARGPDSAGTTSDHEQIHVVTAHVCMDCTSQAVAACRGSETVLVFNKELYSDGAIDTLRDQRG
jgi:hypothetical protein